MQTKPFLLIILFVGQISCNNTTENNQQKIDDAQKKENSSTQEPLPIDGLYSYSSDATEAIAKTMEKGTGIDPKPDLTIRFDKGKGFIVKGGMFALKSGTIIYENVTKVDRFTYKGEWRIQKKSKYKQIPANILANGRDLVITLQVPEDMPFLETPPIKTFYCTLLEKADN